MTINEAINRFKQTRSSTKLSADQMIEALSRLDRLVKINIIDTHEGESADFNGYTLDTDGETELLVLAPYDDIYIDWLDVQNELLAKDYKRYNNAVEVYDTKYQEYASYYNRTRMPLPSKIKYL